MRGFGVVCLAVLLAGCGGGTGGSDAPDAERTATAGSGDASESAADKAGCDLLTDAEVGEALGTTIAGHEESGLNGCRWRAESGTRLTFDVYAGSAMVDSTCDAQKYLGTGREEAVPGLGDSALWKSGGSLVVCAPRAVIRFNVDNSNRTAPEDREGLITLARSALGRL